MRNLNEFMNYEASDLKQWFSFLSCSYLEENIYLLLKANDKLRYVGERKSLRDNARPLLTFIDSKK